MVSNIRNNAISEIDAKKRLNTLNIIRNSETKDKRVIPGQNELLNSFLFDDLSNIILTDKTLKSESQEDKNEENENEKENENENENENDYYDYENQNKK